MQGNPDRERAYKGELSFGEYDEQGFIIAGSPAAARPVAARSSD